MGLREFLRRLLGMSAGEANPYASPASAPTARLRPAPSPTLGLVDLAFRLRSSLAQLQSIPVSYARYSIPKRSGGQRTIDAPAAPLKALQRTILRRLLKRLPCHPAATGFEPERSIVTNAAPHVGAAVVVRMDLQDFFPSTTSARVRDYFQALGWDEPSCALLTDWCTLNGGLPQGAPTSPRLSNLVNYPLDVRLTALAERMHAVYTRYADDITFSFAGEGRGPATAIIRLTKLVCQEYGYRLHLKRKLRIRRRHQSQRVTGLVVNDKVALPRETRRRIRAIEHHIRTGRHATLTPAQLAGWRALLNMIRVQAGL